VLRSGSVLSSEPVSPELVLVDPELARRERARLEERAYLDSVLDVAALRRAVETYPPPVEEVLPERVLARDVVLFARRRLVPAALLCSLLANGFLVAKLVTRESSQTATPVAVRIVTSANEVSTAPASTSGVATSGVATNDVAPTTSETSKAVVERKLASLIISAPARKLPRNFVDPATGLVKNNVRVVCRRRTVHAFLCSIRLPSDGPREGILVRYHTRGGTGTFTWYGYKRR
jgi:hypothetical protein